MSVVEINQQVDCPSSPQSPLSWLFVARFVQSNRATQRLSCKPSRLRLREMWSQKSWLGKQVMFLSFVTRVPVARSFQRGGTTGDDRYFLARRSRMHRSHTLRIISDEVVTENQYSASDDEFL